MRSCDSCKTTKYLALVKKPVHVNYTEFEPVRRVIDQNIDLHLCINCLKKTKPEILENIARGTIK